MFRLVLLISALIALAVARSPKVRPIVPILDDGRIIGGRPTTIEEHPYQVSLEAWGNFRCGGSIISSTKVLTAAHCTDGFSASSLSVRAGSTYRESGGVVSQVSSICQHPGFVEIRIIDNDVSVLRLASSLPFGSRIQPIALVGLGGAPSPGTLGSVSGWGSLYWGGPLPTQLHVVEVPRVSQADCKAAYGSALTNNMICFGYPEGGKDMCKGDSGGPIKSGGVQVGVVSWGACGAPGGLPGVYADVSAASIRNHILSC